LARDLRAPTLLSIDEACTDRTCERLRIYVACLPRGWSDPRVAYTEIDIRNAFDWIVFFPEGHADRLSREDWRRFIERP